MKAFVVSGRFRMGHNKNQPFSKQFAGSDEADVRERTYSDLGSRHGVDRLHIHIDDVRVLAEDEELDPVVRHVLETKGGA